MNNEKILIEIQDIFRDIFDEEQLVITKDTTSEEIERWNSLTHIQLITILSKKYNKTLSIKEMGEINSVQRILDIINKDT